jgi:antitoxin PrlF
MGRVERVPDHSRGPAPRRPRRTSAQRLCDFHVASKTGFDNLQYFCKTAIMKSLVTVTNRGVVTLPASLRRALGIKADDTLIAETTPEGLLLRPAVTLPVEIYSERRIREFDEAEEDLARAMRSDSAKATKATKRRR